MYLLSEAFDPIIFPGLFLLGGKFDRLLEYVVDSRPATCEPLFELLSLLKHQISRHLGNDQ